MLKKSPGTYRPKLALLLGLVLLALTAASSASGQPIARVGTMHHNGTIVFDDWKFKEEISNGLPVHEIGTEISNGFLHVALYAESGCEGAMLPLWTANGTPLRVASLAYEGPVFLVERTPFATLFRCRDDGCEDLADDPWEVAACGRLGIHSCTCTVTTYDHIAVYGPDYCTRRLEESEDENLEDFVYPEFIDPS